MAIARVSAKLAGMRKPQEFVIYPRNPKAPDQTVVQGDRAIGAFGLDGRGILTSRNIAPCGGRAWTTRLRGRLGWRWGGFA